MASLPPRRPPPPTPGTKPKVAFAVDIGNPVQQEQPPSATVTGEAEQKEEMLSRDDYEDDPGYYDGNEAGWVDEDDNWQEEWEELVGSEYFDRRGDDDDPNVDGGGEIADNLGSSADDDEFAETDGGARLAARNLRRMTLLGFAPPLAAQTRVSASTAPSVTRCAPPVYVNEKEPVTTAPQYKGPPPAEALLRARSNSASRNSSTPPATRSAAIKADVRGRAGSGSAMDGSKAAPPTVPARPRLNLSFDIHESGRPVSEGTDSPPKHVAFLVGASSPSKQSMDAAQSGHRRRRSETAFAETIDAAAKSVSQALHLTPSRSKMSSSHSTLPKERAMTPPKHTLLPLLRVVNIALDSPAIRAGFEKGDLLCKFGSLWGATIRRLPPVKRVARIKEAASHAHAAGALVPVVVQRLVDGEVEIIDLQLSPRPFGGIGLIGCTFAGISSQKTVNIAARAEGMIRVHVILSLCDKWVQVPCKGTVADVKNAIIATADVGSRGLSAGAYVLRIVNSRTELEDDKAFYSYNPQPEDDFEFLVRPHPMTRALIPITVILLDGKEEVHRVDLARPVSALLSLICLQQGLKMEAHFLRQEGYREELRSLLSLEIQDVRQGSRIVLARRARSALKKYRYSVAALGDHIHAHAHDKQAVKPEEVSARGAILEVAKDYKSHRAGDLNLVVGSTLTVIREDPSGFWRGRILSGPAAGTEGTFPVDHTQYSCDHSPQVEVSQAARAHMEEGMKMFGQKRGAWGSTVRSLTSSRLGGKRSSGESAAVATAPTLSFHRVVAKIPQVVEDTVTYLLDTDGYLSEGIFRISGSLSRVREIVELYATGGRVDFKQLPETTDVVSNVLKRFLQGPQPLLASELYAAFVEASRISDSRGRMVGFKQVIDELPIGNWLVCRLVFSLWHKVDAERERTKMGSHNLGIVFAPTILRPLEESIESLMDEEPPKIIGDLIADADLYFPDGERIIGAAPWMQIALPSAPHFARALAEGKELLRKNLKLERAAARAAGEDLTSTLTASDLADILATGDTVTVDNYIATLPRGTQNRTRTTVLELFESRMQLNGVEKVQVDPATLSAARRQTVFAKHTESVILSHTDGDGDSDGRNFDVDFDGIAPELVAKLSSKGDVSEASQ